MTNLGGHKTVEITFGSHAQSRRSATDERGPENGWILELGVADSVKRISSAFSALCKNDAEPQDEKYVYGIMFDLGARYYTVPLQHQDLALVLSVQR